MSQHKLYLVSQLAIFMYIINIVLHVLFVASYLTSTILNDSYINNIVHGVTNLHMHAEARYETLNMQLLQLIHICIYYIAIIAYQIPSGFENTNGTWL